MTQAVITEHTEQLARHDERLVSAERRLDQLEAQGRDHGAQLGGLQVAITGLVDRIGVLERRLAVGGGVAIAVAEAVRYFVG